jgi:hypothetical protein
VSNQLLLGIVLGAALVFAYGQFVSRNKPI